MLALEPVDDAELKQLLAEHRRTIRRGGPRFAELFPRVLPAIAEAARRVVGLRPYRVQLMGAIGLAQSRLVEMATGEGKTLTIALAAAANGWLGRPCHVVTANDYLAERDAKLLGAFYAFCGLRVGHVSGPMEPDERRKQYGAEVVYTTSKELVADFLRDRLLLGPLHDAARRAVANLNQPVAARLPLVLRGIDTVIVDEADNQMIDEAATPLIISRRQENPTLVQACAAADRIASTLLPGEDYDVEPVFREARLREPGREKIAAACAAGLDGLFASPGWMSELVQQALRARHYYLRDRQYVVQEGQIVIVDEFTGRLMVGRSWRLGLHQAVEAKEGVAITPPTESLARLSFQRFFRLFHRLAGITGTAREAAGEFWQIYELTHVTIPPHRKCIRAEWPARYFLTADAKWAAIVEEIVTLHAEGRPVLIGTRSVAASEHLGKLLADRGLAFALLNAVRHREEAAIVHLAGEAFSITIATNMAGRGTDIRLGQGVAAKGGLHVILSEWHESGRIDRQLRGRAGRQGDPGSTRTFASLEDELIVQSLPGRVLRVLRAVGERRSSSLPRMLAWAFRRGQRQAEKRAFRQRKQVLAHDRNLAENLFAGAAIDQL